jgi:transcriptional regulator with XRE-family HTH domain
MSIVPSAYTQNPEQLIRTLLRAGWSQESIADSIGATQPTVSRILSGVHKDPRYSVVENLRRLVLTLDDFSAA